MRQALCALAAALFLGGCGDVTVYEPGVYKGTEDPLNEKATTEELQSALNQRVQYQSDR